MVGARYKVPDPLPEEIAAFLRTIKGQTDAPHWTKSDDIVGYLARLSNAGWSLRSIANEFDGGVVIDTVRRPMRKFLDAGGKGQPIPDEPVIPASPRRSGEERIAVRRVRYPVPEVVAARLRELYQIARTVRGTTPLDSPKRDASRRLTELLAAERSRGASFAELGRAMGPEGSPASWSAVKFRLGRYGFVALPESVAGTLVQDIASTSIQTDGA